MVPFPGYKGHGYGSEETMDVRENPADRRRGIPR